MRIGIDAWPLSLQPTGIGHYVRELCLALAEQIPDAQFFLYSPRPVEFPDLPRWHVRRDTRGPRMPGQLWLRYRLNGMAAGDRLDVFWATRTMAPRFAAGTPVVSTVHDLNVYVLPGTMALTHRWAHRLWFRADVARAAAVATVSAGTARRLAALTGREADAVVRPGVSNLFRPRPRGPVQACLARYGITGPYLLAVGTFEPRKNLRALVEAYAALHARGGLVQRLVLAGAPGWRHRALLAALQRSADLPIRVLGYVPRDDLPLLYSGADVFVFPSLYEGFGMPVLEARACGARIVASDIPEIREAGGERAIYVPPTVPGLIAGIERALRQSGQEPVGERGPMPSWDDAAKALVRLLRVAAAGAP